MYITLITPKSDAGILGSYANHHYGSLMLHFVCPILSVLDFYVFDEGYIPKYKHAVFSIIPPLVYVFIIYILSLNGYRWAHGMSAPYSFVNFGAPTGWFGFDLSTASKTSMGIGVFYMTCFLILVFVLIGMLLLFIKKKKVGE